jgi:hypothetical protein
MIGTKQLGMFATLGLAIVAPGRAAADYCYGEEQEWKRGSECTDSETGASAKAGISNFVVDPPLPLGLYVGMPQGPRRASDWTLAGWTYDSNGNIIDDCSFVVRPPDTYHVEYEIEACQDAVTILAFGDFSL